MKIHDAIRSPASSRRPGTSEASGGQGFDRALAGGVRPASGPVPVAPLTALEAILALQEVGDPLQGRRPAVRRGHDLLDELEGLRHALIDGVLSAPALRRLAGLVDASRSAVDDPALAAVLDEIDLRAAVEVAKLERDGE